jgi:uncharacterized protein (TIGR02391 family)
MATKPIKTPIYKTFTSSEIDLGIKKLERRITELEALNPNEVAYNDATVETAKNNIRDTVIEIFGQDSPEADDYKSPELYFDDGHITAWYEEPDHRSFFKEGIRRMIKSLRGLIKKLEEKRLDLAEDPTAKANVGFAGLSLHPRIAGVCTDLFRDKHYSQAVFNASKALVNYVKERSGRNDLDGTKLMTEVFSKNNSVLVFNDLKDQTDEDEQQGMMYLFMGAVSAVRNPRGHSFLTDTPEDAIEYIGLLSMLANRLEKARKK